MLELALPSFPPPVNLNLFVFLFLVMERGKARFKNKIKSNTIFFKLTNHRILTGYVSGSIRAVSEYQGSIRLDTRTF